jgi:hypothetical protein
VSCNMSKPDRLLRSLLIAPVLIIVGALIGPASVVAIILYVLAGVMLATSAMGFCPLYPLLRIDTTKWGRKGATRAS